QASPGNGVVFSFSPTLDGTEGFYSYASVANALAANGNFLPLGAGIEGISQALTTSPFGGPYRPDWSQVSGSIFSGASSSVFKVWGTTARCGATPPTGFVTVSRGIRAQATSPAATPASPAQSRQTLPDNKELLYKIGRAHV